jgi:RND family efflux transporter MFP subunit
MTITLPGRAREAAGHARPFERSAAAATLGLALLLGACSGQREGDAAGAPPVPAASAPGRAASAPPVGVTTVRAQRRDVPVLITTTGIVTPLSNVDLRPQVTSVVAKVHVKEGQLVRAGELLFTLDARADQANVAKAQAQVARDEAALADARRQLQRSRELLAQNFVSQGALDSNQTLVESQAALVAADRAALDAARLTLSYNRIAAPAAGRLGAINVYPGSVVQANQTSLVSVTQMAPIAVAFSLPQRHLADALAALKDGGAPVHADLPDAVGTLTGQLRFVDNTVDAASGTVKVKALFDNRTGQLWPGAFVNVSLTARVLKDAVVVPQASVIQGPRGAVVYVVQEGRAQPRAVQVLYAQGQDAAVSGVGAGERIVLEGRQNLRPGVSVVERDGEAATTGRASSAVTAGSSASASAAERPAAP